MSEFGSTLKILRQKKELTQTELAEKLQISKSAISMYENNNREPDFETLELIADFFNVDMAHLINGEPSSLKEEDSNYSTIAAHHDGEDWTAEELEEIELYKELIRKRREKRNKKITLVCPPKIVK